jgi:hypothetical protein
LLGLFFHEAFFKDLGLVDFNDEINFEKSKISRKNLQEEVKYSTEFPMNNFTVLKKQKDIIFYQ